MPDTKISALTALAQASIDTASDLIPIVDTSAGETKRALVADLVKSVFDPANPGAIGGTTPAAGAFTTLSATGQASFTKDSATGALNVSPIWNNGATNFNAIYGRVTNTASGASSNLIDLGTVSAGSLFKVSKTGSVQFASTSAHYARLGNDWQGGLPCLTGGYSSLDRSAIIFNGSSSGTAVVLHSINDGTMFSAGAGFNPTASSFLRGYGGTNSQLTFTFGAARKDINGNYTGAGHLVVVEGGQGSSQSTGYDGGSLTIRGGAAAGSGNNNGGNLILTGGGATGSGTVGRITMQNLPTSSAGLSAGDIWNDAGTLKIV